MLTVRDLDEIGKVVDEKIEERTRNLPTRDELFEKMDKTMGELKDLREEHTMLSGRVYDNHQPRIEKIEKKLGIPVQA